MEERPRVESALSTRELAEHALAEVRLLARAELLHARLELKAELHRAMAAGITVGAGLTLGLCGLAVLFVSVVFALPLAGWGAALVVGGALVLLAALLIFIGVARLPKKPMERTKARLLDDVRVSKERYA